MRTRAFFSLIFASHGVICPPTPILLGSIQHLTVFYFLHQVDLKKDIDFNEVYQRLTLDTIGNLIIFTHRLSTYIVLKKINEKIILLRI